MPTYDYAIVGGGIVGLSTAMILGDRYPEASLLVLEKESDCAQHQTGRNSGVIHSGIYYKPGSFKAEFARAGSRSMVDFCEEHGIEHEVCGKVIVATKKQELPLLQKLYQRGLDNQLDVTKVSAEEVKEVEPHVRCLGGIRVQSTGIVNYRKVSQQYMSLIRAQGGIVKLGTRLEQVIESNGQKILVTNRGDFATRFLINCAGLHSDRVARLGGADPGARIVPFRGEYYELTPEKRRLVKTLIYPVPDPDFPFLGVHFTRMIDGSVHAGPNAVLAFKREGYRKTDVNLRDVAEIVTYAGFWKLAARHAREGLREIHRSLSKAAFVRSLQELIPEVQTEDLIPCQAGVRAQALAPDGKLVDDFLIIKGRGSLNVCNAPSPAATASLEIGKAIVSQLPIIQTQTTVAI